MAPHQQRVLDERNELSVKLDKLRVFIGSSDMYKKLAREEQERMMRQARVMSQYIDVLDERIAAFN